MQILGELGWTIQIIYDLTGLVPLYYRPPYGDVDNRVRALAKVRKVLSFRSPSPPFVPKASCS